jgi:hypothetical protein
VFEDPLALRIVGADAEAALRRDPNAFDGPAGSSRLRASLAFEVDHPATQAWKCGRLADTGIAVPPSLAFAPVDVERDALADRLRAAG